MAYDCTDIKAILSGYVDGEIDSETRHTAERHLSDCAACRALVNEAEGLDELIAMDAAAFAPKRLPDGFVDSVMSRTVYARLYEQAGWSWTNWLGWVAAAACLGLAASIWFLDRQALPRPFAEGNTAPTPTLPTVRLADNSGPRSWIYEGGLEPSAIAASNKHTTEFVLDDATSKAIDEQLALAQPASRGLASLVKHNVISPEDSDTLHATAVLLDMLADSDLSNFADIERVREIASYDDLPQRLADLRSRMSPAQRAVVMAAESVILRIVNGPIDLNDLKMLHDTATSMHLATQIGAIGGGRDIATSL